MKKEDILKLISGGDLRSIAQVSELVKQIKTQKDFDTLVEWVLSSGRLLALRCMDAIEKITILEPAYLHKHKKVILNLLFSHTAKEIKWHLAPLSTRLSLTTQERELVAQQLANWLMNTKESRIVRVNALQALYDLNKQQAAIGVNLQAIASLLVQQNIPSLTARLKRLGLLKGA